VLQIHRGLCHNGHEGRGDEISLREPIPPARAAMPDTQLTDVYLLGWASSGKGGSPYLTEACRIRSFRVVLQPLK